MQLAVLGYAATTDVRNVPIVVVDSDRSAGSQELISRFTGSGIFELVDVVSNAARVDRYLENGDAWMALSIPRGYGENVAARPARRTLQVLADGSDASSTNIALGYATNLVAGYAQELVEQRRAPARPRHRVPAASSRGCASGSIRLSRAATSCCRGSSRCCCWS